MKTIEPSVQYVTFEDLLQKDGYLVYTNVGTSMLPLLRQRRDIIEIRRKDPGKRCKRYDAVLYKRGDKYILHRILKVRPKDYVICGDHCIWREKGVTDDQILGVLARVIRDGKSIYPTDRKYRIYVHLWCDFYHVRAAILYSKMIFRTMRRRIENFNFLSIRRRKNWEDASGFISLSRSKCSTATILKRDAICV